MSLDLEHNAWPSDSAATVISIDAEVIISRTGSKANGSQVQEGESLAAEALPVLGQPTAAVQPSYGAFDNPALRQDREALGLIGPLDDLHPDAAADAAQTRLELRPLIAAVGVKLEQKR